MGLIDATRIEQYILNNCSDNEEINAIYAEIINAPTVDAVEVVRCKDCRFCGYDKMFDEMWCNGKRVSKDWFCADGKREEDGSTIRTHTIPKDGYWVHGKELSRDYIGDVCVGIHYDKWWCSECHYPVEGQPLWKYCPNCGAVMEVKE